MAMKSDMVEEMLKFNRQFVADKKYEAYATDKYPNKKTAIVTCMDTRLVALLPAALGLEAGDVKMIKNAGGMITDPLDSTMRSLLVAVYELGVEEIMVIGHTNCGVEGMKGAEMLELMERRGVKREAIETMKHAGIDVEGWLDGFERCDATVADTVALVKNHPLMAPDVAVKGYIIDTETGLVTPLEE